MYLLWICILGKNKEIRNQVERIDDSSDLWKLADWHASQNIFPNSSRSQKSLFIHVYCLFLWFTIRPGSGQTEVQSVYHIWNQAKKYNFKQVAVLVTDSELNNAHLSVTCEAVDGSYHVAGDCYHSVKHIE